MTKLLLTLLIGTLVTFVHASPLTPERIAELRAQIRTNFFIPEPLPALAPQTHRRFEPASGVVAEAVTYATEFGTRVPAILYLPNPLSKNRKIPGLVIVNGHGGDKYSWYSYYSGIAYARAGAAVLTYDQAGEGERSATRSSSTREHDRLTGDEVMARRLAGLMMTDVMQAVSYLAARPEVDAARIGAAGYSLGSFVMALTGAVETRLCACVMVGGGNLDGPGERWDSSKPMCQGLPYRSLSFLGDRPAVLYALHGPSLIWNGRIDSVVNIIKTQEPFFEDLRARVIKERGSAESVFEFGFTSNGGHRPYFTTKPVALWLAHRLDFPNWTEASIRALPETHISVWAQEHGVAIDKTYMTEETEGGTLAIGDNVPRFERESLSVFTPTEWEKNKSLLTFDAWVTAARAAKDK
jgi:dipeptidyl aminopeptidase/acylaminoacyl peptidase